MVFRDSFAEKDVLTNFKWFMSCEDVTAFVFRDYSLSTSNEVLINVCHVGIIWLVTLFKAKYEIINGNCS